MAEIVGNMKENINVSPAETIGNENAVQVQQDSKPQETAECQKLPQSRAELARPPTDREPPSGDTESIEEPVPPQSRAQQARPPTDREPPSGDTESIEVPPQSD